MQSLAVALDSGRAALQFPFSWTLVYGSPLKNLCFHLHDGFGTSLGPRVPNGLRGTGVTSWLVCRQRVENERPRGAVGGHQAGNRMEVWQPL